jgi:hypothetical protein
VPDSQLEDQYKLEKKGPVSAFPWTPEQAPVLIKTKAKRIPSWGIYNEMTGPIPYSITYQLETAPEAEEVVLIPYGCTSLRISQFPVVRK